ELSFPGGDRGKKGISFGTDREAEGEILDVAPGEDAAASGEKRGPYLELRVRGVGFMSSNSGLLDQFREVHGDGLNHEGAKDTKIQAGSQKGMKVWAAQTTSAWFRFVYYTA